MERKIKKNQILIKICCVIAAFILWLYIFNIENPIIERKIAVPVTIVNNSILTQSKFVQVGQKEYSVSLLIRGNASDLYSVKASDFQLQSDLSSYVMKKGENIIPVSIKKSPSYVTIINNENLWVKLQLDELKQKTVSINILSQGKPKEGYFALTPILKTQKAQVSGAENVITKVKTVVGIYDLKSISSDINTSLMLQAQDISGNIVKDVTINPSHVEATIPIGKIKSVPVNVKMQDANVDISKLVNVEPEKVDIAGKENIIEGINEIDTEPISLSEIQGKEDIDLKLVVPWGTKLIDNTDTVRLKINSSELNNTDKISQKQMDLKIQIKSLSDDYTAQLSPDTISIVVSGYESVLNNISESSVSCYVDASSITDGEQTVSVVVSLPSGVSLVSQNLQSVNLQASKKTMEGQNANNN